MSRLILLVFIIGFMGCVSKKEESVIEQFQSKGFVLDQAWMEFIKSENQSFDSADLKTYKTTAGKVLRVLFFEDLDSEGAKNIARDRSRSINMLFASKDVPYVGKISVTETCLQKNDVSRKISDLQDGFSLEFRLLANKNFVYGSCSEAEDVYASRYIIRYCAGSKTLLEARIFQNKEEKFEIGDLKIECEK